MFKSRCSLFQSKVKIKNKRCYTFYQIIIVILEFLISKHRFYLLFR